jgi:hypothetical protein
MADSQHTVRPAGVTQLKRASYLRHVQIHMELLRESLTGEHFGCGVGEIDREAIDRHLLEIWGIASAAQLERVEVAPPADADPAPSAQVIPFRPRAGCRPFLPPRLRAASVP